MARHSKARLYDTFELWCLKREENLPDAHISDETTRRELDRQPNPDVLGHWLRRVNAIPTEGSPRKYTVTAKGFTQNVPEIIIDFSAHFHPTQLLPDTKSHIAHFTISECNNVTVRHALVRTIDIRRSVGKVTLETSCFQTLLVRKDSQANITLRDCLIGELQIEEGAIRTLVVDGGSIRSVECPAPDRDNPFSGSITILPNVTFPTSTKSKILKGAQGYRNLRSHLERLQNLQAANLMRSLELATERKDDRGLFKAFSGVHGFFSDHGVRPGKSLAWALSVIALSAVFVFMVDGGCAAFATEQYHGWQSELARLDIWARAKRSLYLPLQSALNPFGIFGTRYLIVACQGWVQILLVSQGLFVDFLIGVSLFALRRRFRLS